MSQFTDFTRKDADLDALWREFQGLTTVVTNVDRDADVAFKRYELLLDYQNLVRKYQKLFGSMMKALLDAKTEDQKNRIRNHYSIKLGGLLTKLKIAEGRVNGNVPADVTLAPPVRGSALDSLAAAAENVPGLGEVLAHMSAAKKGIDNLGKQQTEDQKKGEAPLAPPAGVDPVPG